MTGDSLTIGIPTAGRPKAIELCLERIKSVVDYPHEIIVLDSTPTVNTNIPYQNIETVLYSDEPVSPAEARKRIADAVETDLLLYLDDDTLPKSNSVTKLLNAIDQGYNMASGVLTVDGSFEHSRELGRTFHWGVRDGQRTLIDTPIYPESVWKRGFNSWDVDLGLSTLLVRTDIFDVADFDGRYDFFYEWLDFFLQTNESGEKVCARLDAPFEHVDIPYVAETTRSEQERNRDRRKLLDKWDIELCRDVAINSESWARSESQSRSPDRAVAQAYADGGISCIAKRAKRKFDSIR